MDSLVGKLVKRDFWPACENCKFYPSCKEKPLHPAFPHTWHWAHEVASFPEGDLVLKSRVGSSTFDGPSTACSSYTAVDDVFLPLTELHVDYFQTFQAVEKLEREISALEGRGVYPEHLYEKVEMLYRKLSEIGEKAWEGRGNDGAFGDLGN